MFTHLGIPGHLIMFILMGIVVIVIAVQRKRSKGKFTQNVQKPGQLKIFFTRVMVFLTIFTGIFAVIGVMTGETEMAIVFTVIFVIFLVLTYFMRRKFDMSYQETDEYFILREKKDEYKVFYEDITYWERGTAHEIFIFEGTKSAGGPLTIKLNYFNPEILLATLADMTFKDQFPRRDYDVYPGDPMKKKEMVQFLHRTDYKYLVKDEYIEETGELDGLHWPEHK